MHIDGKWYENIDGLNTSWLSQPGCPVLNPGHVLTLELRRGDIVLVRLTIPPDRIIDKIGARTRPIQELE